MGIFFPELAPGKESFSVRQRRKQTMLSTLANVVQDGVRQDIPLSGDGRSPESSTALWRATTNLAINGGFQTNTTGATAVSSSISRVTSQFKFGSASCEVITSNAAAAEGFYETFAGTVAVYAVSAWVRGAGGGTVRMAVRRDSDAGLAQTGTAVTLTSAWQKITLVTTNLTAVTWRVYVETNVQQNITFQVDGLQAELNPIVTPYVETDGATASRGLASIILSPAALDETTGWFAIRMRMGWASASPPSTPKYFMAWVDDGTNYFLGQFNSGATVVSIRRSTSGNASASQACSFAAGDFVTFVMGWTSTQIKMSFNGAAFTAAATTNIPVLSSLTMYAGTGGTATQEMDSEIFWVAAGTGSLSDANVAAIAALGNVGNQPAVFPGACKFYWQGLNTRVLTAV